MFMGHKSIRGELGLLSLQKLWQNCFGFPAKGAECKTKGYHVEHNFGHGQQYLAAVMLSLNLLAFLFHTVLEWSDDKYALLRRVLARRQTFFNDIRALTRYIVFDSWEHLIDFMLQGLELQPPLDTG
jgi:hypothetical protein